MGLRQSAKFLLSRQSRTSPIVHKTAIQFHGSNLSKAQQIAKFTRDHMASIKYKNNEKKKGIFRRSAHESLTRTDHAPFLRCIESSNLAIALLKASGVKAWLARAVEFNLESYTPEIHDVVEFEHDGHIYSINFFADFGSRAKIELGPTEKTWWENTDFVLRGTDSHQISGVIDWKHFTKFRRRILYNFRAELRKNKNRINQLVVKGIIPPKVLGEITYPNDIPTKRIREIESAIEKIKVYIPHTPQKN